MSTLFISDLHLQPSETHITEQFFAFLANHAAQADALYILGDLFEVWIGDPDAYQLKIQERLKIFAESGIKTYFMAGNRDFLINKQFADKTGCIILDDPTVIDLYGKPTLLTHGDRLCSADRLHQYFRTLTQMRLVRKTYLALPLTWRKYLADRIRGYSKQRGAELARDIADATFPAITANLRKYQVKQLIHGHTHRPSIEFFLLDEDYAERVVLSDWGKLGNMLVCEPNGEKRLVYF